LKIPLQCPLILVAKLGWKENEAMGNEENKAVGN
jgi:hypothetical protein